jgi:moderate conductance mechanosensitive channel
VETIKEFIANINWEMIIQSGIRIVIILILTWIVMLILSTLLKRMENRLVKKSRIEGEPPSESQKRIETITRLLKQASYLALWVIVLLIILKELKVEIGPILAGAGVIGLAIGFGAQNLVRDVISGFFIILENQVRVGDVAIINGTGGLVEKINFRTIILRDLSGIVHVFPNGAITTLSNLTNEWSAYVFDIGVAYKENTDRVIEIMKEVGRAMKEDEEFGYLMLEEPEIFGVDKFADSAVMIKGRIKTKPIRQWAVGRQYLRRVKLAFDEQNIEIPFPHQTLYFGEESKPIDLQILEKYKQESAEKE